MREVKAAKETIAKQTTDVDKRNGKKA